MMRMVDLIRKKRDGQEHTTEELEFIVSGAAEATIKDYQLSSWLMAAYLKGLTLKETKELTHLMAVTGETLDLSSIKGIKVDKHSTGGVGDKVTLILAPLIASAGGKVAKISGRGLGHTGGTVDKLESIPDFNTSLSSDDFIKQINDIGLSVVGQTQNITPADKIFYALRDVTATVDSLPLITASVLSKKIAAGADVILIDIKYGSGAFMKKFEEAKELSKMMVKVGKQLGKSFIAAISDMSQPLGHCIGHTLEIEETIETLKGNGPEDLTEICIEYGAILLEKSKIVKSIDEGRKLLTVNITNGVALNKFREMIKAQNGNEKVIEDFSLLPQAEHQIEIISEKSGYVSELEALSIAYAAKLLGAGRDRKEDLLDLSVGVKLKAKIGDSIKKGDVLAVIHANHLRNIEKAMELVQSAYKFSIKQPKKLVLIKEIIS